MHGLRDSCWLKTMPNAPPASLWLKTRPAQLSPRAGKLQRMVYAKATGNQNHSSFATGAKMVATTEDTTCWSTCFSSSNTHGGLTAGRLSGVTCVAPNTSENSLATYY